MKSITTFKQVNEIKFLEKQEVLEWQVPGE